VRSDYGQSILSPSLLSGFHLEWRAQSSAPMKQTSEKDFRLLKNISDLLESDLCNPQVEEQARVLLLSLRERGYPLPTFDLEDDYCLICLQLTLECAADLIEAPQYRH
jgi:hypothetical protein